jgi:hypothetical protein
MCIGVPQLDFLRSPQAICDIDDAATLPVCDIVDVGVALFERQFPLLMLLITVPIIVSHDDRVTLFPGRRSLHDQRTVRMPDRIKYLTALIGYLRQQPPLMRLVLVLPHVNRVSVIRYPQNLPVKQHTLDYVLTI